MDKCKYVNTQWQKQTMSTLHVNQLHSIESMLTQAFRKSINGRKAFYPRSINGQDGLPWQVLQRTTVEEGEIWIH